MPPFTVDASGDPGALGRAHGSQARARIQLGLDRWATSLREHDKHPDQLWSDLNRRTGFRRAVAQWAPMLLDELEGIAEGAGVELDQVFALNCMDEAWWWHEKGPGCSVVAVTDRGPHPVAGQNMDLHTWQDGTQVVLRVAPDAGPGQLLLSQAGMVALCGANSAGLVLLVNTLDQLPVDPDGLPVAFVARLVLMQPTLADAEALLRSLPHASGQAYTLVGPDGLVALECGADTVVEYRNDPARPGARWHTNHPLEAASLEASGLQPGATTDDAEDPDWMSGSTAPRLARLDEVAPTITDANDVKALLADSTSGVCIYPGRWRPDGFTFGSVVARATVPPEVEFALGPPDRMRYESLPFLEHQVARSSNATR